MVALLLTENVSAKTHQGIRAKFIELFIKTKIFPSSIAGYVKMLLNYGRKLIMIWMRIFQWIL